MIKVGITGQQGFIGQYLLNTISKTQNSLSIVGFKKSFFDNETQLDSFVKKCDVIIHLAALNRHDDHNVIYNTNITLIEKLISSLKKSNTPTHVIMSSSIQENENNYYGKSKKDGRELFIKWSNDTGNSFSGLIIPNVFGPFGKPNYNSVVATFCYKIVQGEKPEIFEDKSLKLIYVGELVDRIIAVINENKNNHSLIVESTSDIKVSEILKLLKYYRRNYTEKGEIPHLKSTFELNLFNTYRSYMDVKNFFPISYTKFSDERGSFVEQIRSESGGQFSFSTTLPGIIRGNHFHTRKIERFSIIKGKAQIKLRRIGTREVFVFFISGDSPGYIDIPIWYTHNIKNIGDDVLYTNFWINEPYNAEDSDTYLENV